MTIKDNNRPNGAEESFVASDEGLLGLADALEGARTVALCIETGPRDDTNSALDPRRGRVEFVSVAARGGAGGVVDVASVDPGPLLEVLRDKKIVVHDAGFCLGFLKNGFGYEHDGFVIDVQVCDAVLYHADGPREDTGKAKRFPGGGVRRRSLADVARDHLGPASDEQEGSSSGGRGEAAELRAGGSLDNVRRLLAVWKEMARRLQALGLQEVTKLEARVAPALAYCQNNGFALDEEGWRRQAEAAAAEAEKRRAECDGLAPPRPGGSGRGGWNWGSPKQVGEALEPLGAGLPRSRGGNLKTDESVLAAVSAPERAALLAQAVLSLRAVSKLASTWGTGWLEPPKKKPRSRKFDKGHQFVVDGRVHGSFNQVVSTGRMSCSSPNLQNVPSELERYFVAPPGRKLLVADYRHLDLVPAAVLSGEEKMLEAFRSGVDVHALTARAIAEAIPDRRDRPASEEEVQDFRPLAKFVTLAALYDSNAHGLAERVRAKFGGTYSVDRTRFLVDVVFGMYPKLAKWRREEMAKADAGDDLTRTLIGRLRLLNVVRRAGGWRASRASRLNAPVQGAAADGFKYAVALTWERRRQCPGSPVVVNLVHDEIVVEIDEDHALEGKDWLERCMTDGLALALGGVYAGVEIAISDRWGTD